MKEIEKKEMEKEEDFSSALFRAETKGIYELKEKLDAIACLAGKLWLSNFGHFNCILTYPKGEAVRATIEPIYGVDCQFRTGMKCVYPEMFRRQGDFVGLLNRLWSMAIPKE